MNKAQKIYILVLNVFLFFGFSSIVSANETKLNISPIVQIISYYDIYGKYPRMMWWGSASIINDKWVIISNDHVVDDGKWALSSAFSVCITKELNQKPVCDYTASLISRDDKLDISMLKIDPVDIYGNPVDYTKFSTINIDFSYEPKNQDETIAIGYPWIGADTISETKGIVSGVSEYNGYKYIKTDTLIAGGNSGGAFVRDGKLIGIPTFGIGWWGENTMGYALSIKEAKIFIDENIAKEAKQNTMTKLIDFNKYRSTIENINSSLQLKDDIFDIKFPNDYQVSDYTKNNFIEITLKKQKDTGINYLRIYVEKSPNLDTERKKFYYLEQSWFYSKDYQKLLKKNIGWIEFYYAVDKTDLSNGESSWGNSYKAIIEDHIVTINLDAPFYDEKRNKEIKKEVENIFAGIKFIPKNLSTIKNNFSTNIPKIDIKNLNTAIIDTGKYKLYLWKNLYEYIDINLNELVEYNGKGKNVSEIYDTLLKDIDSSEKSLIKFKWYEWYIVCSDRYSNSYSYYNYYSYNGYYGYNNSSTDEYGNPVQTKSCQINIYFPLNEEINRQNYLSIDIISKTENIEKNLEQIISFLSKNLELYSSDKEVNIPNIFKNQVKLNFTDINKQTKEYKNFLRLLVKYKAIENTSKFDGNKPLKWGEYLDMYTKWIYNFNTTTSKCSNGDYTCKFKEYKISKGFAEYKPTIEGKEDTLESIFKSLWIDYTDYVDSSKIYDFEKLFKYKLAWISIGDFTDKNIYLFESQKDEEKYKQEWKKIQDFDNRIYGLKKITIADFYSNYSTSFIATKENRYYTIKNKIVLADIFNDKKISSGYKETNDFKISKELFELSKKYNCNERINYTDYILCSKSYKSAQDATYLKYDKNYVSWDGFDWNYYSILNKASALNQIFSQVDFWLFDTELAKKKDTVIEENK